MHVIYATITLGCYIQHTIFHVDEERVEGLINSSRGIIYSAQHLFCCCLVSFLGQESNPVHKFILFFQVTVIENLQNK